MVQNKGLEQKPKAEIAVSSFKKYVIGENEGGKSFNPFQNKFTKKKTLFIKDNFINYDIDKLIDSAKKTSGRLLDICQIRKSIIDVANVLQTTFLSAAQKIEEINKIISQIEPRLYIDYHSTLSYFSYHFPSLEEFYIFDMEYYDCYPSYWLA